MLEAKLVVVGGDAKKTEVSLDLPVVIGRGKEAGPHRSSCVSQSEAHGNLRAWWAAFRTRSRVPQRNLP